MLTRSAKKTGALLESTIKEPGGKKEAAVRRVIVVASLSFHTPSMTQTTEQAACAPAGDIFTDQHFRAAKKMAHRHLYNWSMNDYLCDQDIDDVDCDLVGSTHAEIAKLIESRHENVHDAKDAEHAPRRILELRDNLDLFVYLLHTLSAFAIAVPKRLVSTVGTRCAACHIAQTRRLKPRCCCG